MLQIFENLQKNVDPTVLENKTRAAEERERQHYESAQRRFADLVSFWPAMVFLDSID